MADDTLPSTEELQSELESLNRCLDDSLLVFARFEASINEALKNARTGKERATILAQRTAYEGTLGIESLIERIDALREHLKARQRAC